MRCDEPELIHAFRLAGGEHVTVRPACPRDAGLIAAYIAALSPPGRYNRFLGAVKELAPAELVRITHLDHRDQTALIVEIDAGDTPTMIGEARLAIAPDGQSCELAISVADVWRRKGVGGRLLHDLECRARGRNVQRILADVLRTNEPMKALARRTGFEMAGPQRDGRLVRIVKEISPPAVAGSPRDGTGEAEPSAAAA